MQFPTQFPFLVIPTGAGPGQQRITINYGQDGKIKVYDQNGNLVDALGGPQGQFILYDSAGNMVISLASAAGTDDRTGLPFQAGITAYTSTTAINFFANDGTWTAANGSKIVVEAAATAAIFFTPPQGNWVAGDIQSQAVGIGAHPQIVMESPTTSAFNSVAQLILSGSSNSQNTTAATINATTFAMNARTSFGNIAWGNVSITPSAANTPTSAVVNYSVSGTNIVGYAVANSSVPGTQVTGVSVNSVTNTSMNVWLTRTNTTSTVVYWLVIGT